MDALGLNVIWSGFYYKWSIVIILNTNSQVLVLVYFLGTIILDVQDSEMQVPLKLAIKHSRLRNLAWLSPELFDSQKNISCSRDLLCEGESYPLHIILWLLVSKVIDLSWSIIEYASGHEYHRYIDYSVELFNACCQLIHCLRPVLY